MVMPIYCCQVSNEEYEKIVNKMKENKMKMYAQNAESAEKS